MVERDVGIVGWIFSNKVGAERERRAILIFPAVVLCLSFKCYASLSGGVVFVIVETAPGQQLSFPQALHTSDRLFVVFMNKQHSSGQGIEIIL